MSEVSWIGPAPIPGEVLLGSGPVEINAGRPVTVARVANSGDRPIQVGSHYHFGEANPALKFDRKAAWGQHLNIPAGTAVRFEPGIDRLVELVPFTGNRIVYGLRGESAGPLDGGSGASEGGPGSLEGASGHLEGAPGAAQSTDPPESAPAPGPLEEL